MRKSIQITLIALALSTAASAANAVGCVSGAIVGGAAGHMVKHGFLGAVGGCYVGHEMAKKQKAQAQQEAIARQNAQTTGAGATAAPAGAATGQTRANPF